MTICRCGVSFNVYSEATNKLIIDAVIVRVTETEINPFLSKNVKLDSYRVEIFREEKRDGDPFH